MIIADLYPGIIRNLMGRTVDPAVMAEAVRKTILELTEDYWFEGLQEIGPIVQFIPGQSQYSISYFKQPGESSLLLQKVHSFFLYVNPSMAPTLPLIGTPISSTTAGYSLTYKSIDRLDVLINTLGMPIHWSRHEGYIWIASTPDNSYYTYMRYQHSHPFPNAGTPAAGTDLIEMPPSWQDILEMASAQRLAQEVNLSTKATELNTRLRGDSQFQQSGGVSGSPGLIFKRTSELERDQTTTVRRFRLRMGR